MALNAVNAANAVGSKVTVAERWIKLYRKIHNLFLKNDFTNRQDFEFTLKQINLRFNSLEQQITTAINQLNTLDQQITTAFNSHTHISPPAPVNPVVTAPPIPLIVPSGVAVAPKTPEAQTTKQFVSQRDSILQATGEPVVPMDATL